MWPKDSFHGFVLCFPVKYKYFLLFSKKALCDDWWIFNLISTVPWNIVCAIYIYIMPGCTWEIGNTNNKYDKLSILVLFCSMQFLEVALWISRQEEAHLEEHSPRLSPTLLLPKRPLSKCSFYRLITLAGTMQCGDTQTSAEVFIFNFGAPTQAQKRRMTLAAALLIYSFPIVA